MRLRRGKVTMGRAHRLLVAFGRKEQKLDVKSFVAYFDKLRPYHSKSSNMKSLFDFLDYESASSQQPDNLRVVAKRDGAVSLRDVQLHFAAVARELSFIDVTGAPELVTLTLCYAW